MTYTPTPYATATGFDARMLRGCHSIDVALEIDNPADPEGDLIEHELCLFFTVQPAEPDVGISSAYVDDWFYCNADGSLVPEAFFVELDKIGEVDAQGKPISKGMDNWHEINLENAMDEEH